MNWVTFLFAFIVNLLKSIVNNMAFKHFINFFALFRLAVLHLI